MSNVSYPGAVSGTSGIATTTAVARTITTVATAATCGTSTWPTSTMVASTVQSATALRPAVPLYQEHSNGAPRKVMGLCGPHINTNHTTDSATVASAVKHSATSTAAVQRSATATAAVQRNAIVASPIRRTSAVASPVHYDNQPVPAVSPVSSTSKNRSGVIRRSKAASPLRSTATHLGTASNRADPVSTPPRATVTATDYP
uniref:Uncharacterized protein n=1 Tax=Anopheles coluzzii TaxID=1518534 RepID=A0A6E8W845_ANOCL